MKQNRKNKFLFGQTHPLVVILLIVVGLIILSNFLSAPKTDTTQKQEEPVSPQQKTATRKVGGELPTLTLYNTATVQENKVIVKTALSALAQAQETLMGQNIKPTDMTSEGLAKYFNRQMNCQGTGNKILCVNGYEYIFIGDGKCNIPNGCYVTIDTNGEKAPNEEWTDPNSPKDRVSVPIQFEYGNLSFKMPSIVE